MADVHRLGRQQIDVEQMLLRNEPLARRRPSFKNDIKPIFLEQFPYVIERLPVLDNKSRMQAEPRDGPFAQERVPCSSQHVKLGALDVDLKAIDLQLAFRGKLVNADRWNSNFVFTQLSPDERIRVRYSVAGVKERQFATLRSDRLTADLDRAIAAV